MLIRGTNPNAKQLQQQAPLPHPEPSLLELRKFRITILSRSPGYYLILEIIYMFPGFLACV
ncbi:hypothetical protein DITRI_Ditri02bG0049600 [Diplodiscus trichospermus]